MHRKIYFAGSIRGGRVDAARYQRIIAYMAHRGDHVLTEHVGDPTIPVHEQGPQRDAAIYERDMTWLRSCDLVVAECTCPSLGVGYELGFAEAHGKPVHIFYDRPRTQLSAMLTGNPRFAVHPYASEDELFAQLDEVLGYESARTAVTDLAETD